MIILAIMLTLLLGILLYESIEDKYREASYRLLLGKRLVLKKTFWVSACLLGIIGGGLIAESQNFWLQRSVLSRPASQMDPAKGEHCYIMNGIKPCVYGENQKNNVLLVGDSHAGSIALTLRRIVNESSRFHSFLYPGCQFLSKRVLIENSENILNEKCVSFSSKILDYVDRNKFEKIYISNRSTSLVPLGFNISAINYRKMQFQSLVDLQMVCSCEVNLIGPTPEFPLEPDFFAPNRSLFWGNEISPRSVNQSLMNQQPFNDDLYWQIKTSQINSRFKYISLIKIFCNDFECNRWKKGWLFSDADHLSSLGAELISGLIRH